MNTNPSSVPPHEDDATGRGGSSPVPAPANLDWLEMCRREFCRRFIEDVNGDDYEFSPNVYGD